MLSLDLITVSLSLTGAAYLALAVVALARRGVLGAARYVLAAYAGVACLWQIVAVAGRAGALAALTPEFVNRHVPLYGAMVLAILFYYLTLHFLRLPANGWRGWALGGAWLAILLAVDSRLLPTTPVWASGAGWIITRGSAVVFGLVMGWAAFIGAATWLTRQAYVRTEQPLHRNRLVYWLPAVSFMLLGDALLVAGDMASGTSLHLVGALVAGATVLTHRLPDVRRNLRGAASYALVTGFSAAIYWAAFWGARWLLSSVTGLDTFWAGSAVAALAVAVTLNGVLAVVRRLVQRVLTGARPDAQQTLGEYSAHISNILDLERLASTALRLIQQTVDINRGVLFRVDIKREDDDHDYFVLTGLKSLSPEPPPAGRLAQTSPVGQFLSREYSPLTQYDVDLLPRFHDTPIEEFMWLSKLGMDVYLPIYAKNNWIGLLALGPKLSRDRYSDEDLALLSSLADQTAVALENARLFEDLADLNNDLGLAYRALDEANQQLEHLDKVKSDFINVLSHELRTPLTILLGYSEIMKDDPAIKADAMRQQMLGGIFTGASRLREIIDSMFDMAKIDSRTLQLNPQPAPIGALISQVCEGFSKAVKERQLTVTIETLSGLPPIEADLDALKKAFRQLVMNAIKYTPDGGAIRIWGRRESETEIRITVHDSGIGIDPRFKELIFTKFYQTGEVALHSTGQTKFKGGGPGLGLAIARGIVEAHGGRVWAESPGYDETKTPGSQFHVVLPIQHQPTAIERAATNPRLRPVKK